MVKLLLLHTGSLIHCCEANFSDYVAFLVLFFYVGLAEKCGNPMSSSGHKVEGAEWRSYAGYEYPAEVRAASTRATLPASWVTWAGHNSYCTFSTLRM